MSIIIFKNVQWKSLSEKEIKKKHLFIQIIYWKIYAKKIQTLISPYIKPPKTSSVKRKQTKHVFAVYK